MILISSSGPERPKVIRTIQELAPDPSAELVVFTQFRQIVSILRFLGYWQLNLAEKMNRDLRTSMEDAIKHEAALRQADGAYFVNREDAQKIAQGTSTSEIAEIFRKTNFSKGIFVIDLTLEQGFYIHLTT